MIDPEQLPDYPHCFFTKDGKVIRNLSELKEELKYMPPDVFNHHVNEQRNDFSNWVKDVFGHERLASRIANAKTRDELIELLDKNVALMILMDMPKPSKEEMDKGRLAVSKMKKPTKYRMRGPSIENKIQGHKFEGKVIIRKGQGTHFPSQIEKTTMVEAEKLKSVLEKEKHLDAKEKELSMKEQAVHTNLKGLIHEKKKHIMHGAVIGSVSVLIVVLLYFAIAKAF